MLSLKASLQIFGWILVFLFPLVVIYLTGGPDKEPLLDDIEYKQREEKKKRLKQLQPVAAPKKKKQQNDEQQSEQQVQTQDKKKKNNNTNNKKKQPVKKEELVEEKNAQKGDESVKKQEPVEEKVVQKVDETVKEIDEHMDPTVNYARVMRIKPEEVEDEYDPLPVEDGWSQVKTRRPTQNTKSSSTYVDNNAVIEESESTSRYIPGLDKKQRENMKRNAKKKERKAEADALQAERLRKHQKELEKAKIQEFYSTGKGKNTPWGKTGQRGSSKRPTSTASINEHGQLIWD